MFQLDEHVLLVFIAFLVLILVYKKSQQQKKSEKFTRHSTNHTTHRPRVSHRPRVTRKIGYNYYPYYRPGYLSVDPRCDSYCMGQHQNCMRMFQDPTKCLGLMNDCLRNCHIVG